MSPPGFEEFVTGRSAHLLRTAHQLTHDWAAAEDLLQTVLTKAWRAWSRIEGDTDPEPYVRRIMFNTYTSWWRRRSSHERPVDEVPETGAPSVANHHADADQMWRALGRLPRRQRAVVVARYYLDMSEAQIADALGCSTGTVKAHASRALAALRADETLRPEGATT